MVPRKLALRMLKHSGNKACALLLTGITMYSSSRLLMSHGSQPVTVPMVNLEMKLTGELTNPIDLLSSQTTPAVTLPPTTK